MPSHKQEAFTLVEIMIVIAIIGILAMIAIPAYKDFTVRSKISEGLSLAAGAKTSVIEYYQTQGNWPTNNSMAGMPAADSIKGQFVQSVNVQGNKVVVTFGQAAGDGLSGRDLVMTAIDNSGAIGWNCHAEKIENKFLPPTCRDTKL
jgi:type IV pilus assembly protein PilA